MAFEFDVRHGWHATLPPHLTDSHHPTDVPYLPHPTDLPYDGGL